MRSSVRAAGGRDADDGTRVRADQRRHGGRHGHRRAGSGAPGCDGDAHRAAGIADRHVRRQGPVPLRRGAAGQLHAEDRARHELRPADARPEGRRWYDRDGGRHAESRVAIRDNRSPCRSAGRRRQELCGRQQRVERDAADDAALFVDVNRPAQCGAGDQQQLGVRRTGELRQRPAARRRRYARPRRGIRLDVLQSEPDRRNPDRRPRRARGERRVHRGDHQYRDQVGRQQLLGPLLDAVHRQGAGVEQHQLERAVAEPESR